MSRLLSLSRSSGSGDLLADRRYAYAQACLAEGETQAAVEMAEQALEIAPRYAPAWFLLGQAREARHRAGGDPADHHGALRAYAAALDLDPDDAQGARMALARNGAGEVPGAISPTYIRALFDAYAPRFERHLVDDLGYRAPEQIVAALDALPEGSGAYDHVLDLGCGTGLVAAALGPRARRLTGIDLSPLMLAEAAKGNRYARLVEGDLVARLADEPAASADLVTAADVMIYVGALTGVVDGAARVLRPGGHLAFSVQSHTGDGLILGTDARYAHGDALVRDAVARAGLTLLCLESATLRHEAGRAVPGRIVVARKPLSKPCPDFIPAD
ncbi:class I SAM-dependent DNA methyltransferase [Methylobacterium gossipiicola]|uniref:Predicted methyltransferase, contains TPR repeat n=1 Tax=Methylobacterium gossipiicola TaxID=582675 RepID=A0A1I2RDZ8_9HYPH|nr:methyltransferase domain-containing protein [Methylobacterium gossipiicola]SFG35996.1 Predicted methyltransferase, contains TPR repeat [Methylobacterium gossipiicola]